VKENPRKGEEKVNTLEKIGAKENFAGPGEKKKSKRKKGSAGG